MRIVAEIPRLQFEGLALQFTGHFFNSSNFLDSCRLIGIDQIIEELINIPHITSHTMLQYIVSIRLMPQQLCQLPPEIDESFADFDIILRIIMRTLRILRHVQLLPKFTIGGISHKRRITGEIECKDPALLFLLFRSQGSSFASSIGQSLQLRFVGNMKCIGFIFLQQILRELQAQHRSLFR